MHSHVSYLNLYPGSVCSLIQVISRKIGWVIFMRLLPTNNYQEATDNLNI